MPSPSLEHMFLQKLDEQLWGSAQKLRQSLDAANYKHVVLTLIFIILKLTGVIAWSWWLVLVFVWLPLLIVIPLLVIMLILKL